MQILNPECHETKWTYLDGHSFIGIPLTDMLYFSCDNPLVDIYSSGPIPLEMIELYDLSGRLVFSENKLVIH